MYVFCIINGEKNAPYEIVMLFHKSGIIRTMMLHVSVVETMQKIYNDFKTGLLENVSPHRGTNHSLRKASSAVYFEMLT